MTEVDVIAASNAADRGLRALADLAAAARGSNYRVIGGHMVHLLARVYPASEAVARVTADADAGMDTVAAADTGLHDALVERGYRRVAGNHYEAPSGEGEPLAVDLLVPGTGGRGIERVEYAGRGFDAIPGLNLALASEPVEVRVRAQLTTGRGLRFEVPIPDVEQAVVLKALSWRSRLAAKDVTDLCTLLVSAHEHREQLPGWRLDTPLRGSRGDAAGALYELAAMIDRRRQVEGLTISAERLSALIRTHVADPAARRRAVTKTAPQPSPAVGAHDALLSALAAAAGAHPRRHEAPGSGASSPAGDPSSGPDTDTGPELEL
ncbi:hypothetical protein [Rhodococcus sp. RDE2]|uniref:hypothetical protein n=1 Tax=Rhodococcus sp. RDE2 TaxID=2885078 RepID=UPI001E40D40F|nr:hypothetical protein [Rhodococcus sp. RDE2]